MLNLTKDNFNDFCKNNELALVDFWAPWCGPCRMLGPVLEELQAELNTAVGKVNVDEEDDISEAFQIRSIPALFLFKNGKLVDKKVGFLPKEALKTWIKQHE